MTWNNLPLLQLQSLYFLPKKIYIEDCLPWYENKKCQKTVTKYVSFGRNQINNESANNYNRDNIIKVLLL